MTYKPPTRATSEFRVSTIPWMSVIPSYWGEERGKWLFKRVQREPAENDEVVTCFRDGTVTLRKNRRVTGFTESLKEIGYQAVRKGELVIHAMDAFAGAVGVSDSDGKCTPVYSVCQPAASVSSEYYALIVREMARTGFILSLSKGIRERSTDFRFETFASQTLPVPPLEEQKKIVSFIQQQDRRIRKFTRNKIKFIKLLELQRTLVTQGLLFDGLKNTKKSRVAIFGQHIALPAHWRVLRARFVFRAITRRDVLPEDQKLSVTQKRGIVPTDQMEENSTQAESYDNFQVCHVGDLVANKYKAHLGVFCCAFQRGIITPNYSVFRTVGKQHTYYFDLLFHSPFYRSVFSKIVYGVTEGMSPLYTQDFYNVPVVVPPYDEQVAITVAISQKTSAIADVISQHEKEIFLIEEYRSRLIADAVTGRIDLRNFQPSDEAESPDTDSDLSIDESDELNNEDEELLAEAVNAN